MALTPDVKAKVVLKVEGASTNLATVRAGFSAGGTMKKRDAKLALEAAIKKIQSALGILG